MLGSSALRLNLEHPPHTPPNRWGRHPLGARLSRVTSKAPQILLINSAFPNRWGDIGGDALGEA